MASILNVDQIKERQAAQMPVIIDSGDRYYNTH